MVKPIPVSDALLHLFTLVWINGGHGERNIEEGFYIAMASYSSATWRTCFTSGALAAR